MGCETERGRIRVIERMSGENQCDQRGSSGERERGGRPTFLSSPDSSRVPKHFTSNRLYT